MRWISAALVSAGWLLLSGAGLAQSVGITAAVNQSARGTPPSAKPRTMVIGDKVIHNEKIETNGAGLLQILLVDGTSFTVGPNSTMQIDSFVYDPAAGTAKVAATLGKGVFRFIGGKTSKSPDGAVLTTPVGTVGIRGGIGDLDFRGGKGTPIHIDMLFGDSITLTAHGVTLGRIFRNGYSIAIGPDGKATVQKTPLAWTRSFQQTIAGHGGQHGGAASGNTVATRLASILGAPGTGTPSPQPGGTPVTTVADTLQPPAVPFVPPDLSGGDSTWGEINNSALAGVYATYLGEVAYTTTLTNVPENLSWDDPLEGNIPFALDYHFGSKNGAGTFTLGGDDSGGPLVALQPNSIDAAGNATFSGSYSQPGYTVPTDEGTTTFLSLDLALSGRFVNNDAGVAHGVAGTMTLNETGFPASDLSSEHPVLSPDASARLDGTFAGTLDHTSTAPPQGGID